MRFFTNFMRGYHMRMAGWYSRRAGAREARVDYEKAIELRTAAASHYKEAGDGGLASHSETRALELERLIRNVTKSLDEHYG